MARTTKKAAARAAGGAADRAAVAAGSAAVTDAAGLEALARGALGEITRPAHVGVLRDITVADDVATVRFATTQGGYPGWLWTVAVAVNPGMEPSVLETELIPAEGALVAPDWVPWADRLEEYLAQQAAEAALRGEELEGDELDDIEDDEDDDEDDDHNDEHDDDELVVDDDVDGVDIDLHLDLHPDLRLDLRLDSVEDEEE